MDRAAAPDKRAHAPVLVLRTVDGHGVDRKARTRGSSAATTDATTTTATATTSSVWPLGYEAAQLQRQRNAIAYDNTKAGLQVVDKRKVEDVIRATSEGSPYYANEQRKLALRQRRLQRLQQRSREYDRVVLTSPQLRARVQARVDAQEAALEATRRLDRIFVHVDMDAFYAAVEEKKNPQLRSVPFGVGTQHMLSTTNYIARQYGVRSGMPGFIGKKLCPELHIVPTDFAAYRAEAEVVRAIAADYDPHFVSVGLDELTMDVTAYLSRHPPPTCSTNNNDDDDTKGDAHDGDDDAPPRRRCGEQTPASYAHAAVVVQQCRERIHAATQLTCSGGIAPTATLAKIASNVNKPNGQHVLCLLTRDAVLRFVAGLPVRRVPGIGPSHEYTLAGLGVATVGDLYAERYRLSYLFTAKTFAFFLSVALGLSGFCDVDETTTTTTTTRRRAAKDDDVDEDDDKQSSSDDDTGEHHHHHNKSSDDESVDGDDDGSDGDAVSSSASWRKSIGQERTFGQLTSAVELQRVVHTCLRVAHERMQRSSFLCSHVVLKTKHRSFRVHQYSKTCAAATDDADELRRLVDELLLPLLPHFADYRLLGVRLDKLVARDDRSQRPSSLPPRRTLAELFRASPPSTSTTTSHAKRPRDEAAARCAGDAAPAVVVDVDVTTDADSDGEGDDDDVCVVTPSSP